MVVSTMPDGYQHHVVDVVRRVDVLVDIYIIHRVCRCTSSGAAYWKAVYVDHHRSTIGSLT